MFRESNTKWMLGKWPGCLEVCRSQLQICPSVCRPWFALGGQMSCTTKSKGLRIDTWVIIAYLPEVFQWSTVTQGNSQVVCFLICLKWTVPWVYIPEHVFFRYRDAYHCRSFLPWCRGQFHRFKTVGGSQRNGFIHGFLATEKPMALLKA